MAKDEATSNIPLLVYDGDCQFCKRWIARWRGVTGDRVAYAPFQEAASRFPEIPESEFVRAVHLIEPDGRRSRGAEAVFRALAYAPGGGKWLWAYRKIPGFRNLSESCYRIVAEHRPLSSRVTGWIWGAHVTPPGERITCWLFLRLLGVVSLIAFLSLWTQVSGLIGSQGILPAAATLRSLAAAENLPASPYWVAPTLCWFNSGDGFLSALCGGGALLSVSVAMGFATAPCLLGVWVAYLSLATVCGEFLWFQWDGLLLECAFIASFLASWELRSRPVDAVVPRGALRLTRWLLFRLLFASAAVKLTSGDPAWRDLTALQYHYETQPLPTSLAWYVHQLPLWFQRLSAGATFLVEGLLPFLIFTPRRIRFAAAAIIAGHQLFIAATGNYGFFNLLTLVLCILLLDDAVWPRWITARFEGGKEAAFHRGSWPAWIWRPVLAAVFLLSLVPLYDALRWPRSWIGPLSSAYNLVVPLRTVNHYGLFAIMTKERPEILVEGSADGVDWKPYEFRYKPGDPARRPGLVAPHQPRLDWQMWFAALSDYRREYWFLRFCEQLLRNSEPVLNLLHGKPFPDAPPRYLRAVVYRYHFTDSDARRGTGDWWRREPLGLYCPVMMLEGGQLAAAPPELQRW